MATMLTMYTKILSFNSAGVQRAMDGATRRALNKAGGWIRKTAKRSIRPRKTISQPGDPPHSHAGALRDLMLYAYERYAQTVVIGPLPFKRKKGAPLLEFGGATIVRQPSRSGKVRRRRMVYRPRPFMGPALDKALAQPNLIPGFWRNQLTGV